MIEAGNPLMNAVGPVVAGSGRFAVTILCKDQPVFGPPVIGDRKAEFVTAFRCARQDDIQQIRLALKPNWGAGNCHRVDGQLSKIQIDLRQIRGEDFQSNLCTGRRDFVELIVKGKSDIVMYGSPGIDNSLATLRGQARRKRQEAEDSGEQSQTALADSQRFQSDRVMHVWLSSTNSHERSRNPKPSFLTLPSLVNNRNHLAIVPVFSKHYRMPSIKSADRSDTSPPLSVH